MLYETRAERRTFPALRLDRGDGDRAPAALPQPFGGEVAAEHERGGGGLREDALPGREDAEPEAEPVGQPEPGIGVTGTQPTVCITWTVVPTMTTSTQATSTPVRISIRLTFSFRCSMKTATPTAAVAARPTSTPSSTVPVSASSTSACRKSTVSNPSR